MISARPSVFLRLLFFCLLLSLRALPSAADSGAKSSGNCDRPPEFYSENSFKVDKVILTSPFDYLHGVRDQMAHALSAAEVKSGEKLKPSAVGRDVTRIKQRLREVANNYDLPLTIHVVIAQIENCRPEANPPLVDVRYQAFASWFPFHFAPSYEARSREASEPAHAAGVSHQRLSFHPLASYNHTTRLFAGLSLSALMPLGAFRLEGRGSSTSHFVSVSQTGQYTPADSWLQNLEWRTGYLNSDAPTDAGRLAGARVFSQVALTSAPTRTGGVLIRVGAAVAGGYDHASLTGASIPPSTPINNSAGDLKTYAGISFAAGRHTFKMSYGLELGQSQTGAHIDFAKHLVDSAADFRLLPRDHKTIAIETRFAAGAIQNLGSIPLAERFFGGNSEQDFLPGETWRILNGPFIRSIPENRLSRLTPNAPVGGENFFSLNLTVAFPVWHRALVPDQIRLDPSFRPLLDGELKGAKTSLSRYWRSKDAEALEVEKSAPDLLAAAEEIQRQLAAVKLDGLSEDLSERLDDCKLDATLAIGFLSPAVRETNTAKRFDAVSAAVAKDGDGSVDHFLACLTDLRRQLSATFVDQMIPRLSAFQKNVRDAIGKIDTQAADTKAEKDLKFVTHTVNALIDEINFGSISPVLLFDAARIGPQPAGAGGGIRYGLGGGLRFSLLDSLHFVAGYAFNPNPRPWEGRGATFFQLEIVSLFR